MIFKVPGADDDEYEEERLAGKSFGSTKSGIAPFYSDKYAKIGLQVIYSTEEHHSRGLAWLTEGSRSRNLSNGGEYGATIGSPGRNDIIYRNAK